MKGYQGDFKVKVARFVEEKGLIKTGETVLVAVSGGADSLALLHVLEGLAKDPSPPFFKLHVAHLDHGLRGRAGQNDARFVSRCARKLGLSFSMGRVDAEAYRRRHGLSLEAAARQLRYLFLQQTAAKIGAGKVAVGHNRDDQVETVLMNFLRGAGLEGLSGMKPRRRLGEANCFLIRPLLDCSRMEIETFCSVLQLRPRLDETNRELCFHRNRLRLELLPHLERKHNPRLRESILRLTKILERENDYLEKLAAGQLQQLLLGEDAARKSVHLQPAGFCQAHPALQARMIRLASARLHGAFPRDLDFGHIEQIMRLCCRPGQGSGELHLPAGLRAVLRPGRLTLTLQQGTRGPSFTPVPLPVPGTAVLPELSLKVVSGRKKPGRLSWPPDPRKEAFLDYRRVFALRSGHERQESSSAGDGSTLELLVRPRREGDRFYPLGAPGSKKLKDYYVDKKIPREERDGIPLVVAGETIIWVAGYQVSELCRVTEETAEVLVLRLLQK